MNDRNPSLHPRLAVLAVLLSAVLALPAAAQPETRHPGASIYKSVGCMACHKWHGMGGTGYGGTPINFRETILDRDQLIEVIACGRPGTAMPSYRWDAYRDYDCYDGMKPEELDEMMPGRGRTSLSKRQLNRLADFIIEQFKGKPNEVTVAECRIFFGESRMCKNLHITVHAGGGGRGH